ncbi:MAG: nucleotidyltransferase family protein [Oscillospiraceae bacterium]|nr:nucleotidyltransferase family protein [Oscillospiraceae bacterium]
MKCLILAAGYATRLYPLTENYPKPLLEVKGRPILDWLIADMDSLGMIDEYVVISNHKFFPHFQAWAARMPWAITVLDDGTTSNETRLGAVRDIQFAMDALQIHDDVLVIAGDNLLDFSLTAFIRYAQSKKTSCIMRYYEPSLEKLQRSGVVMLNEADQVLEMAEKPARPASHWCSPAFYYYTATDAARIPEGIAAGCHTDAPGSYVAWLCKQAVVHAMEMPGSRYDIGNLESYQKICQEYEGIIC